MRTSPENVVNYTFVAEAASDMPTGMEALDADVGVDRVGRLGAPARRIQPAAVATGTRFPRPAVAAALANKEVAMSDVTQQFSAINSAGLDAAARH